MDDVTSHEFGGPSWPESRQKEGIRKEQPRHLVHHCHLTQNTAGVAMDEDDTWDKKGFFEAKWRTLMPGSLRVGMECQASSSTEPMIGAAIVAEEGGQGGLLSYPIRVPQSLQG